MVLSDKDGEGWKLFVTCWAVMECLLFGGLVYGWGSLNFVFKAEGIFADLCPQETPVNTTLSHMLNDTSTELEHAGEICIPQDSRMALCFTIATTVLTVGCVILGHLIYKCGTRVVRLLSYIIFTTGSLMMAFTTKESPWWMYPGLTCLGIGGIPLFMTNCQVSNLYVERSSSVVGLLSGAFDTSSVVLLLVKIASENGVSRRDMFLTITALHALVLVSTFFFLPKKHMMKHQDEAKPIAVTENCEGLCLRGLEKEEKSKVEPTRTSVPPLSSCVRRPMFITNIVWFSLLELRFLYFLSTLNPYLERILDGDGAKVSYFTNVCYFTMMGSPVTSIIAGRVYDWQKTLFKDRKSERYRKVAPAIVPQGVASLLSVILSVLVWIPNPNLLYVTFIVVTVKRSFLYSISASFISELFPEEYFGILYGIMFLSGGVAGLFQYPLFMWSNAYWNGSTHVDLFLLIMVCVSFLHPAYLCISSCREEKLTKGTL